MTTCHSKGGEVMSGKELLTHLHLAIAERVVQLYFEDVPLEKAIEQAKKEFEEEESEGVSE